MKIDDKQSWVKGYPNRRFQVKLVESEFSPHLREDHLFAIVRSGVLRVRYRECSYNFKAGEVLLIPAGEIHAFSNEPKSDAVVWFHLIDSVVVCNLFDSQQLPKLNLLLKRKNAKSDFLALLFKNANIPLEPSWYNSWLHQLIGFFDKEQSERTGINDADLQTLIAVKRYVQKNAQLQLCLNAISAKFKFNKWKLSRQFKPVFGVTLFEHIHASRITAAKKLLTYQNTIAEIALATGYNDQSHFNRFFKRYVGLSPTQWRRFYNDSQSKITAI